VVINGDPSSSWEEAGGQTLGGLDVTVPVSARIWNYWMGGKDYYQVDKRAGDQVAALFPGIRDMAKASRLFLGRAVRFLAEEAGIRQFLDIGTGLPSGENTHEVALRAAPGSRIVYVDNDPLVLAHAKALLTGASPDATGYIAADLNDPDRLLSLAREKLDFGQPFAIMLMGILGHIGDPREKDDRFAVSVVERLKAALPPGGYLVQRDATDTSSALAQALGGYEETGAVPVAQPGPDRQVLCGAAASRAGYRPDPAVASG
jgi:hypothetical protein